MSPKILIIPYVAVLVFLASITWIALPGFRPKRSAHHAVKQIQSYLKTGYRVAVDMDLAKFFDRVNHDALMARVARKVRDKAVLRLIGKYLRAGVLVGDSLQPTETGVPQGSPLTPPTMLQNGA